MEKKREIRMFVPRMARERERKMWVMCGAIPTHKGNRLVVEIPLGRHEFDQHDFLAKVMLIKIGALYHGDVLMQRVIDGVIANSVYVAV